MRKFDDRTSERDEAVVPVLAEELVVDKEQIPTGGIRVHRRTLDHDETVDLPLVKEHVDVRRVLIDREVDGPLPVRREGDTTIIPIVEEVLIIEKRFRLKEEIHVIRSAREERHQERVPVRRQEADIEPIDRDGRSVRVDVPADKADRPRRPLRPKSILTD